MPSKKQQACVTRYVSAHYDQIKVNVPKGQREKYKQEADRLGLSVNQLFITAVDAYLDENKKAAEE